MTCSLEMQMRAWPWPLWMLSCLGSCVLLPCPLSGCSLPEALFPPDLFVAPSFTSSSLCFYMAFQDGFKNCSSLGLLWWFGG